jgi:hypothetical protein
MRRLTILVTVCSLILVGLVGRAAFTGSSAAQDSTPMAMTGHPVVGTWLLLDDDDPESEPSLVVFTSDGVYQQTDYDGTTGFGVWEATGPTSAAMTFLIQFPDDEGNFGGSATIRASIEVDPDGQRFTAAYTLENTGEGFPAGEYGPGAVTATRMQVEPMGTPVGTFEDLFSQFEDEGAPEASPTS